MSQTRTQRILTYEDIGKLPRIRPEPPAIDLTHQTPNTHLSTSFQCIDGIIGRVTPFQTMFILDFVWPDGTRVKETPNFTVWDVAGAPVQIPPVGSTLQKGDTVQLYYINDVRRYEIRHRQDGRVIKLIQFPTSLQII